MIMTDTEERPFESGSYILRRLVENVALNATGDNRNVTITCVEVWSPESHFFYPNQSLVQF